MPRTAVRSLAVLAAASSACCLAIASPRAAASSPPLRGLVAQHLQDASHYSSGLRAWLNPPEGATEQAARASTPRFGSNVDANDPARDTLGGQSETAIAAQVGPGGRHLVMAAWNDASGFASKATTREGSGTGVGISEDGGRTFTDLTGLPNQNADEQWSGDPAVVALHDGRHFVVASLYFPSATACTDKKPAYATVAVSVATVTHTRNGPAATFTPPIVVTNPGNVCTLFTGWRIPKNLAILDKDWMSYDPKSRTLAMSYTRYYLDVEFDCTPQGCVPVGHSGNGQIELARAHVPISPAALDSSSFKRTVVWPEEPFCPDGTSSSEAKRCGAENSGAYVAVAAGGDSYVAWERNLDTNFADGDPYIYEHAALLRKGATTLSRGGPGSPVVLTTGRTGNGHGGVKSMDNTLLAGYSRGTGNDFPRVAIDSRAKRAVFVWNDASLHPLGNIWMRSAPFGLGTLGRLQRVDDGADYALRFLPAVSVRTDGVICTSWYDRRRFGATSTKTDYFAECRPSANVNRTDVRITTGATDWAGTSSVINPNFGDYTDNASDGKTTYFTWSDGRVGVPQPFVDSR